MSWPQCITPAHQTCAATRRLPGRPLRPAGVPAIAAEKAAGGKVWEALVRHEQVPGGQHVEANLVARGSRLHCMTKMAPPALTPLYASERLPLAVASSTILSTRAGRRL